MPNIRWEPFRVHIRMDALWDEMAQRFEEVTMRELEDALRAVMRQFGADTRDLMKAKLLVATRGGYTKQLYQALGLRVAPGFGQVASVNKLWIQVGLYRKYDAVPPDIGRPPERYAYALEYGGRPLPRRVGGLAIKRITNWAIAKGLPPDRIIGALKVRGSKPHPFIRPTIDKMESRLPRYVEKAADAFQQGWLEEWVE